MKKISTVIALLVALAASPVAAQSVYYPASSAGACVGLARNLSSGMRGSDVRSLQQFLLERNYPGSGSWMVTGFYGRATAAAVRNFQSSQGISQTGIVDGNTRLAIDRASCGSNTSNPMTLPSTSYGAPTYTPSLPLGGNNSGYTYPSTNTIYNPISAYIYTCGNSFGSLGGNSNSCPCYSQGTSNSVFPYNITDCKSSASLAITMLNPTNGAVGTSVTVFGTGFSANNNTVRFGSGIITALNSADGRSVSFLVPSQLSGYGAHALTLGTYFVSVSNSSGATSNTLPFEVTSLGTAGTPTISTVSGPNALLAGTPGQWIVTVNNTTNPTYTTVSVNWGDAPAGAAYLSAPQQIFGTGTQATTFTHAYAQAGNYTIQFTVSNGAGQSSISTQTVSVTGNANAGSLSLVSLAPSIGSTGALVVLTGSGFTQDNVVHFGIGGVQHVPSWNGTTIYYTVPQYLSPCDVSLQGSTCALYVQQVVHGQYPVFVSNSNGTTQTIYFQVQ